MIRYSSSIQCYIKNIFEEPAAQPSQPSGRNLSLFCAIKNTLILIIIRSFDIAVFLQFSDSEFFGSEDWELSIFRLFGKYIVRRERPACCLVCLKCRPFCTLMFTFYRFRQFQSEFRSNQVQIKQMRLHLSLTHRFNKKILSVSVLGTCVCDDVFIVSAQGLQYNEHKIHSSLCQSMVNRL